MQRGGRLQWQKAITDMNVCQTWVLVWSQISFRDYFGAWRVFEPRPNRAASHKWVKVRAAASPTAAHPSRHSLGAQAVACNVGSRSPNRDCLEGSDSPVGGAQSAFQLVDEVHLRDVAKICAGSSLFGSEIGKSEIDAIGPFSGPHVITRHPAKFGVMPGRSAVQKKKGGR